MINALTSLTNIKSWLEITNTTNDTLLTRLMNGYSRAALAYIQKHYIYRQTLTRTIDGNGGQSLILPEFPIISITSLTINGVLIPPATGYGTSGWTLEAWDGYAPGRPQEISLDGYCFKTGKQNVTIVFTTGYAVTDEEQTIPATPYEVTANQFQGAWMQDDGVTMNGTAMTAVTGSPTTGQYAVSDGVYTFAAADSGNIVKTSYSYSPFDLEQAVIEMVAERFRYKDRIGQNSKSLAGQETVSFSQKDLTDSVKLILQPYMRVIL